MSTEHVGQPQPEYVEIVLTTLQDRRSALVNQVREALGHHSTMHQALVCALTAFMGSMLRELLASACILPTDPTDPHIAAMVDRIVNHGTVDMRGLMMIGDIAYWCHMEGEEQPLLEELEELRPKRQEG